MALITPDASSPLSNTTTGTTVGETPTPITPAGGGDSVQLLGRLVTIWFVTAGTGITVTLDSVRTSDQGNDNNLTITLPASGQRRITLDASQDRFKQVSGNIGSVNLTYSAVTNLTMYAWYTN